MATRIGEWNETTADMADEIAGKYAGGEDDGYINIQRRALEIMGGSLLPENTWDEFDAACKQAANEA